MGDKCFSCGKPLPKPVMCSVSHTINPGMKICSECSLRESSDYAWAEGRRIAYLRVVAARFCILFGWCGATPHHSEDQNPKKIWGVLVE